jgi:hypothetical protein
LTVFNTDFLAMNLQPILESFDEELFCEESGTAEV